MLVAVFFFAAITCFGQYGDFGSSGTFSTNGWCVSGPNNSGCTSLHTRWIAASFQQATNITLGTVSVAAVSLGGTPTVYIAIYSDSGGHPGNVLESWTANLGSTSPPAVTTVTSVLKPTLQAGAVYWVEMQPYATDTLAYWYTNNIGLGGGEQNVDTTGWTALSGYNGQTLPVFSVLAASASSNNACTSLTSAGSYPSVNELFPGTATGASFPVTTPNNCTWTASLANVSNNWITSFNPKSGTGTGSVSVSFPQNNTSSVQVGSIIVQGAAGVSLTLSVTLNPISCRYTASSTNLSFSGGGGTQNLTITPTPSNCFTSLSVSTAMSWLTPTFFPYVTSGALTTPVTAAVNPGAARSDTLTTCCSTSDFSISVNQAAGQTSGGGGGGGSVGVSTSSINFNSIAGNLPVPTTFSVSSSSGTLSYGISISYTNNAPAQWLSVSQTSGTVTAGNPNSVTATVSSAALNFPPGTYTANIVVSGFTSSAVPGGEAAHANSTSVIANTLVVSATGLLFSTQTMVFSTYGNTISPQDPQQLTIGGANLPFTYLLIPETSSSAGSTCGQSKITVTTVTNVPWLLVNGSAANGSGTGGQTFTLSVSPGNLAPGTYRDDLNIIANGVTYDVAIYLVVASSTTPLSFTYVQGGTLPASIPFSEIAGCTAVASQTNNQATLGASSDRGWLSVNPTSTLPTNVAFSITANPTGLAPGTYSGLVALTDFAGEVQIFQCTLTVQAGAVSTQTSSALPHFAAQGQWTTGVFVINTSNSPGSFSINWYDDSGHLEPVPFSTGTTSKLTGTIPALGSAYYETTPGANVIDGWGQVLADPGIVIQALFRNTINGTYYEAAVPPNAGSKEFEIPFDARSFTTGDPIYTGFGVANLDPANPATLTCTAHDNSGTAIANPLAASLIPAQLPPLGHAADYIFKNLAGKYGTIDCTSNTTIAATALRFIGSNTTSTLPVINKPLTAINGNGALAQFAAQNDGQSDWTTAIFAVNTSPGTLSNFFIQFNQDNGSAQAVTFGIGSTATTSLLTDTIDGFNLKYYETGNPNGSLIDGSGIITAGAPVVIQALFRRFTDNNYYEAAVPSATGSKEFIFPFDQRNLTGTSLPLITGFAVANLDKQNAATLTCTVRDQNGAVIPNALTGTSIPATLPPSGHGQGVLTLTGKYGTIDCTSTTVVVATALRFIGNDALSTLVVTYR